MALPDAASVRALLEGYDCNTSTISDAWIDDQIDSEIMPFVENFTKSKFDGVGTVTELYSGSGRDMLMLNRKNIVALTAIRLVSGNDIDTVINVASLVVLPREGILKVRSGLSEYYNYRIFPKGNLNIQVTYTYGYTDPPKDIANAIKKLAAILVLDNIEGRTGGGQLSAQGYNRNFGNMGKYTNIRKRFNQQAMAVLRRYSTSVVGQ